MANKSGSGDPNPKVASGAPAVPAGVTPGSMPATPPTDDAANLEALGLSDGGMPGDELDYLHTDPDGKPLGATLAPNPGPVSPRAEAILKTGQDAIPTDYVPFQMTDRERERLAEAVMEGMEVDPAWPRVVAMKLGPPGSECACLIYWNGTGAAEMRFKPFQRSPPLHPAIVGSITKPQPHKQYGYYWQHFWLAPPTVMVDSTGLSDGSGRRGDCHDKMSWHDKISGRTIQTCVYGDCPRHPPGLLRHSVWQAQRFLAQLRTDSAIRNYTRLYDPRLQVGDFAQLVIDQRTAQMMRAQGYEAAARDDLIF